MKILFIILSIYILSSILENLIHRYVMHKPLMNVSFFNDVYKNHILHHLAVGSDGKLNKNIENYNVLGNEESLCLSGWEYLIVFGTVIFIITPLCIILAGEKFYSLNSLFAFTFALLLCIYAKITWNTIHPYLHKESPLKCGNFTITNEKIINNFYYKWLMNNHLAHHLIKGDKKGNFNITLPGADFLFGTYNTLN